MSQEEKGFVSGFVGSEVLTEIANETGFELLRDSKSKPTIRTSTNMKIAVSTLSRSGLGSNNDSYEPSISLPVTAIDRITDAGGLSIQGSATAFLADGQGGGEIVRHGGFHSDVTTKGMLVSFSQTLWYAVDRSDSSGANSAEHWLGVALDVDGGDDEGLVLLRGYVRIDSSLMNNYSAVTDVGKPVYISTTAGEYDLSVSTTANDIVRVVGYLADTDGTDHLIYFCPDNTFIKVAS